MRSELERLMDALADRYRFERELGEGGMATVYLAADLKLGRRVAIKILSPDLSAALAKQRFLREIELTAQLDHPHIVPLLDSGAADGLLYYVMPLVQGETLRARLLRERQLTVADALQIARDVADALHHAHRRGVIHRDIKPENILLADGHARVADFGIARAIDAAGAESLTATGLAIGTAAYMSPEQATGERDLDARSDVYSLGCVLYEMLAGEPPFTGTSPQAMIAKRLSSPVPRISIVRDSVSPSIEQVVVTALAKAPADRFRSAEQFGKALATAAAAADGVMRPAERSRVAMRVAIILALLTLPIAWVAVKRPWVRASVGPGVALLPCEGSRIAADRAFVAERWSEELIHKLVRIGLAPKSWMSVRRYQDSPLRVAQIARELNARMLIRCRVAEHPNGVSLAVELIHAGTEEVIWSSEYGEPYGPDGVNAAQAAAARDIAARLNVPITQIASVSVGRPLTRDTAALRLYRLARHFRSPYDLQSLRRSVGYFRGAIERDSSFAHAYVGLADVVQALAPRERRPSRDAAPEVDRLLRTAIALDPGIAEAHSLLAETVLSTTHDWIGAEQAHRRALLLDPGSAEVHTLYGFFLLTAGRTAEAIAQFERAINLDPTHHHARGQLVRALTFSGQEKRALTEIMDGVAIKPDWPPFRFNRALILIKRGQLDSAVVVINQGGDGAGAERGWLYAIAGRRDKAQQYLDSLLVLNTVRPVEPAEIAQIYAGLGDHDQALDWLERAYAERSRWLLFLLGPHPAFNDLRDDARFLALRKAVRFP